MHATAGRTQALWQLCAPFQSSRRRNPIPCSFCVCVLRRSSFCTIARMVFVTGQPRNRPPLQAWPVGRRPAPLPPPSAASREGVLSRTALAARLLLLLLLFLDRPSVSELSLILVSRPVLWPSRQAGRQYLIFSDVANNRIWKWEVSGTCPSCLAALGGNFCLSRRRLLPLVPLCFSLSCHVMPCHTYRFVSMTGQAGRGGGTVALELVGADQVERTIASFPLLFLSPQSLSSLHTRGSETDPSGTSRGLCLRCSLTINFAVKASLTG